MYSIVGECVPDNLLMWFYRSDDKCVLSTFTPIFYVLWQYMIHICISKRHVDNVCAKKTQLMQIFHLNWTKDAPAIITIGYCLCCKAKTIIST